jgi:hypothetical protein
MVREPPRRLPSGLGPHASPLCDLADGGAKLDRADPRRQVGEHPQDDTVCRARSA